MPGPIVKDAEDEFEESPEFQVRMQAALQQMGRRVREEHFAAGNPIVYLKDGVIVWEYPDGRIVPHTC